MSESSADPFSKVSPGDRIFENMRADTWNGMLAAAEAAASLGKTNYPAEFAPEDSVNILIQNATGADLIQFGIVAVSGSAPPITAADNLAEFYERRAMIGVLPSASATIAITQEPIGAGKYGTATLVGMTPVKINVVDAVHTAAAVTADPTKLTSSATGGIPILWKESGTGTKWALVLLPNAAGDVVTIDVVTNVCDAPAAKTADKLYLHSLFGI